ncbi:hypothetical protein [Pseudomonas sp. Gutcm_11s]|uniref:hypothetical protein n=1 Tax=Pseudomonas sp. Gutcm_11s TaxID=3026088 RepID=UPI00235EC0EB|nr:hypothetical protein [Pseudomonas sp. Gutcm_11s]MDD0841322.1 hypothetical protein [Pseudomonas sp. Gutcm_11s]
MNRSDSRSWEMQPSVQWHDTPAASSSNSDAMEWEANLLLPQMAAALEHPCSAASANRLVSLWRALRTSIRQPPAGAARH